MKTGTKADLQQHVKALTAQVRDLREQVRGYDLSYSYLADLVNDAACLLTRGEPIDQTILDEFVRWAGKIPATTAGGTSATARDTSPTTNKRGTP